jgi:hypothetical protein
MQLNNVNQDLERQLRDAYRQYAKANGLDNRNVKLPSKLRIDRTETGLLFHVGVDAVTANMQTDAAAFEAWALVLRLWLEKSVPQVVLDWDEPKGASNGHYERFLYRVAQFGILFPDWFSVADPRKAENRQTATRKLVLNVASARANATSSRTTSAEYKLEKELVDSGALRDYFRLELVGRQFPVGLFAEEVSAKTRIFTGGKSAIDIVGVGEDGRFFIFELKAGDNFKVGILSELLLYTGLIRQAAQKPPRIEFAIPKQDSGVGPEHVRNCTGINAVMLVEKPHPLLEHPALLNTLNVAANARWNCERGAKPVCFSRSQIREIPRADKATA